MAPRSDPPLLEDLIVVVLAVLVGIALCYIA